MRQLLEERRAAGCAILVSTHNLDEAERLADRVAVLHGRLLALDRPAALRQRLMTGRVIVRVAGDAASALDVARASIRGRSADAGALIAAACPALSATRRRSCARWSPRAPTCSRCARKMPALEDVYLHLLGDEAVQAAS